MARLYISGEQVEIKDDLIGLTIAFNDIIDYTKHDSGKTSEFQIPATDNNRLLLGFPENVNIEKNYSFDALLEIYGMTFTGTLIINDSVIQNGTAYYNAQIISDNFDWVRLMKDGLMTDVDITDQNHIYSAANITTAETATSNRLYSYPLINWGRTGNADLESSYYAYITEVEDRFPAINYLQMLTRLFAHYGYTIESNSLNSGFFEKLWYLDISNWKRPVSVCEDNQFTATLISNQNSSSYGLLATLNPIPFNEITDPSGNYDGTTNYEFTAPFDCKMKFKARIVVAFTLASTNYLTICIGDQAGNNTVFGLDAVGGVYQKTVKILDTGTRLIEFETEWYYVTTGDVFSVVCYSNGTAFQIKTDSTFECTIDPELRAGNMGYFNDYFGDTKQLDWLKDVSLFSSLVFATDRNERKVYVEVLGSWWGGAVMDWSDKLDMNSDIDIEKIRYANEVEYYFTNDDADGFVQEYQRKFANDKELGSGSIDCEQPNQDNVSLSCKELAPTFMDYAPHLGVVSQKIPKIWNKYAGQYQPFGKVTTILTVTGGSGSLQIIVNGLTYSEAFSSTYAETCKNWVNTHQDAMAVIGIDITYVETNIIEFVSSTRNYSKIALTGSITGTIVSYPERIFTFKPRILYYFGGAVNMLSGELWNFEGTPRDTVPVFSGMDDPIVNLSFDDAGTSEGQLTRASERRSQLLRDGNILRAYFWLDQKDINGLVSFVADKSLQSPIFLQSERNPQINGYWYLRKVNNYVEGRATQCELIQALDKDYING